MAITKKTVEPAPINVDVDAALMEQAFEAAANTIIADVQEAVKVTDKVLVLNSSSKRVCLESGILNPGDEGIATRAELGTLWQHLELAEKE